MKCYFALSDDVSNSDIYYAMFICTLETARKNTSLELHCLFDFRKTYCNNIEDDRIYRLLKQYNVIIHLCSIDFEEELFKVYTDTYLKEIQVTKTSMYSRFLRFMIADIENEDEYYLYADTDLIFLKDVRLEDFSELPDTIGVCPEFDNNYSYTNFNAGVMLIKSSAYKNCKKRLIELLSNKQRADIECCDQGYLNTIFKNNFIRINNIYNWKPYWGINNDAKILHIHGLKPRLGTDDAENYFIPFVSQLMLKNKSAEEGWKYYFELFANNSNDYVNCENVLNNLAITMRYQEPDYFKFHKRLIRKIKKIILR